MAALDGFRRGQKEYYADLAAQDAERAKMAAHEAAEAAAAAAATKPFKQVVADEDYAKAQVSADVTTGLIISHIHVCLVHIYCGNENVRVVGSCWRNPSVNLSHAYAYILDYMDRLSRHPTMPCSYDCSYCIWGFL